MRNPSKSLTGRWIWITGASSGIGESMTRSLIQNGNNVIVTARNSDKLETLRELAPDSVWVLPADISTQSSAQQLREGLAAITPRLDTVILNAGNCEYLDVDSFDIDLVQRVTEVNYMGFARCVYAALPRLYASTSKPHLVGVSSASVLFGLPRAEAYGSSKAAMTHFLESLRVDLYRHGVDVSIVYPGFVDTPLTRQNDFPMPWLMDNETASRRILDGIGKRKSSVAFPWPLIATLRFLSALPASWSVRLAQKLVRASTA